MVDLVTRQRNKEGFDDHCNLTPEMTTVPNSQDANPITETSSHSPLLSAPAKSELYRSPSFEMGLPLKTKLLVFTAVLGGFLFGYDTGVMSGALVALEDAEPSWNVCHMYLDSNMSQ